MTKTDASTGHNLFRKKPVVIEAVRLGWDTWSEMCDFAPVGEDGCRGVYVDSDGKWFDEGAPVEDAADGDFRIGLLLPTLEGEMLAVEGDFIIKGVQGEFYPCKPDIFAATYEPANTKD